MSEVVQVALITGAVSAFGAYLTYLTGKRSGTNATAIEEKRAEVELAKVKAEAERQRSGWVEEERRNRQATYHRLIAALEALAAYDGRKDHGGDRRREIEEEYRFAMAGARVFGSPTIDAALLEVREVVKPFLTPGASPPDDWREDLAERVETLANEMRSDLHE